MGDFLWHSIDGIYSVYIADVTVSDVSFLRAGLANGVFGRNIKEKHQILQKKIMRFLRLMVIFMDSGTAVRL